MNIAQKIVIAQTAINSIATHDDVDAAVLKAALAAVGAYTVTCSTSIDNRIAAETAATLASV